MTNTVQDDFGNEIFAENDKIYLNLKEDNRKRLLGRLELDSKTLYVKRNRERHLHYKSNSYGFNYLIIKNGTKFNKVVIADNIETFTIPKDDILEKGRFLFFKQQGFERQIFISLDDLQEYKTTTVF